MTSRFRKWMLSSPPAEWALNQVRELLIGSLRQGPIPKHIAFVMDGNRRYARQSHIETVEGHNLGFEALARILEVCYKAGVEVVSIYAFSIENFKRSKYEVDGLMDMAKIKLTQMAQHGELLDRYGARIKVSGERSLLKPDVLEAIDRACAMTSHNDKCVLNICFPYTSREEITSAIRKTVEDYSRPISQPPNPSEHDRRHAFKEERIKNTIREQHRSEHQDHKLQSESQSQNGSPNHDNALSPSSSSVSLSSSATTTNQSSSDLDIDQTQEQDQKQEREQEFDNDNETLSLSSANTLHNNNHPTNLKPTKLSSPSPIYPSPELITPSTLDNAMYTSGDPPLDLLIRTSGVERLSDFMLWQCHENTMCVFLEVLWPQFDLWSFLPVLWEWQWRIKKEERMRSERERGRDEIQKAEMKKKRRSVSVGSRRGSLKIA